MKRTSLILTILLLVAASCRHDVPEYVRFNGDDNGGNVFKARREFTSSLRDEAPWTSIVEQETKATGTTLNVLIQDILGCVTCDRIHQIVGTYRSVDTRGDSITLSGKLFLPEKGPVKNLIVVSHYTIGSNAECPSESFSFEGIYAAKGYAVIAADYIGYGETRHLVHPYLQAETTARNVIDIALAVRPFLARRGIPVQSDEVILLGYSQGGATTMYAHYLIENDPDYAGKFKLKKTYAGAGPYNVARTYDISVKKDLTGIPCAVPMIIQGMNTGMSKPLDIAFFFKEPLLSNYDEWLNSKKYTVYQINRFINADRLSSILTEHGLDKSTSETARLYRELVNNGLPDDFYPETPVFMFHSEDDQTVPFINSQLVQRQFRGHEVDVEYDFGHYGSHQSGAVRFIAKVLKMLD